MDSTALIKICPYCKKEFEASRHSMIYCSSECQLENQRSKYKERKHDKAQKLIETILKKSWKQTNLGMLQKFYEIFGEDYDCDICHLSFDDNIKNYGVPLHIILKPGINGHHVLNEDNWFRYCTKCYASIMSLRDDQDKI